jgi:hypothetical protein
MRIFNFSCQTIARSWRVANERPLCLLEPDEFRQAGPTGYRVRGRLLRTCARIPAQLPATAPSPSGRRARRARPFRATPRFHLPRPTASASAAPPTSPPPYKADAEMEAVITWLLLPSSSSRLGSQLVLSLSLSLSLHVHTSPPSEQTRPQWR